MTPAAQGTIRHGLITQGWLPTAALIATTALVGPYLGNAARPIFLSGCVVAAWYAWARSPGSHLQAVLVLFSFTPYVRRLIDVTVGFDGSGLMIAGPLL